MTCQSKIHFFYSHHRSVGFQEASWTGVTRDIEKSQVRPPNERGIVNYVHKWFAAARVYPRSAKQYHVAHLFLSGAAQTTTNTHSPTFVKHTFTIIVRVGVPHGHLGVRF